MSRISFKEFSGGLPVTQTAPKPPRLPQQQAPEGNMLGRILKDAPSDIVETFQGVIGAGRNARDNFTEAFTKPGLSLTQRATGALVAPFAGVASAGGEAVKGAVKLFTTDEFEETTNKALQATGKAVMDSQAGQRARQFYESLPEDQKYTLTNIILPFAEVASTVVGGGTAKAGLTATKRTAQEVAESVIARANPVQAVDEVAETAIKSTNSPVMDTIRGAGTQIKDFFNRTAREARDTAEQSRVLAEMPEPKSTLIRNGADERVVNVIDKSTPEEVKVYRELVNQAKLKEADPTPNTAQPKVIAGREFLKPVNHLIEKRKAVGQELGEYRKNLSTAKTVDTNVAFRNFHAMLKNEYGVRFDKDGKIVANTGTIASSDVPQIQKLYDALRSDKKNSQVELDQWLQRTYKDYDLVQAREKTFSEEVSRIAERARSEVRKLMPEDYNQLATDYAQISKPLNDMVKLLGYKGSLDELTAKELKVGEVALRVLGNAADRPQSVIDSVLEMAEAKGYQSTIDLNKLIYVTDQLEDLYDITPSRGFSGSATRGINQSSVGVAGDVATLNVPGLFDRAMKSRASQKEIQESFEAYLKYLDEGETTTPVAPDVKKKTENSEIEKKTENLGTETDLIIRKVPDRDTRLTGRGAEIQEASIAKYEANPEGMVDDYLKENGKIINTDEARKQFTDVGYNGANSASVHEASSALSKSAWRKALAENEGDSAIIFAGGSGTGKTSVAQNALGKSFKNASAVLDGNLSSLKNALTRIKEAKDAGKEVRLAYVYREPEDAWINGVIARMLNNPDEGGRVVPLSTFLENHKGSFETIKALSDNKDINELIMIDNSFGKNAHQFMDIDKLNNLSYDIPQLRSTLLALTKQLYEKGEITKVQYKSLIK